jgi:glyoxylase I family protein
MAVDTEALTARREKLKETHLRAEDDRPSSAARGVHHVALICSDVERTIRFYQDLVGFPLVEMLENRDYPGSTHFFFDLGNHNLLAFFDFPGLGLESAIEAIGSLQHLAISATPEQFERIKARLDEHGVEYLGPDRGVEESIYFKDPDNIQIEITREPLRGT